MRYLFRGPARIGLFGDTECIDLSVAISIFEVIPETFSMMLCRSCDFRLQVAVGLLH